MAKKLSLMPYAQAEVYTDTEGNTVLRSYSTDVIILSPEGWLVCTGLYSATTRKHISAFMREYTPYDYQFAKKAFEGRYTINIYTGEVID